MFKKLSFQISAFIIFLAVLFVAFGVYYVSTVQSLKTGVRSIQAELQIETGGSVFSRAFQDVITEADTVQRLTFIFLMLMSLFIIGITLNIVLIFVFSLRAITGGIERFKEGDRTYRIPLRSQNEFGIIASYLNQAIETIASTEKKLKEANRGLESKVAERTKALQTSEERARHLIENLSDVITILSADGTVTYQSPSIKQVFGYTPAQMVGKNIFDYIHPDDADTVKQTFELRLQVKGFGPETIFRFRHQNGTWRYLEAVSNNLLHDRTIDGFIVTSRDITERMENQAKVRELDELKNTFIRTVSHQLRTPLNSIRWNLEALMADEVGKLKKEQKEFVRVTHDAGVEIIRRVDDLLTAMDIEEGRVLLKREAVSLDALITSTLADVKKAAAVKDITLSLDIGEEALPIIAADPDKLRSVLSRLIENAVTYTQDKGEVTVTLKKVKGKARVEVSDTGVGIPKSEQARVFTRFYRATNASAMKPDSSGLGLSIAKYFVEQHGGEIGFKSTEGQGSTFWFTIPLR